MKMILHITTYADWENALGEGVYRSESLNTDGFIHCSTSKQVVEVANRFYAGRDDLVLLCIDRKKVQSLVHFEAPVHPDGSLKTADTIELFPHIYGPLNLDAVVQVIEFAPDSDGYFRMPDLTAAFR